MLVDLGRNDIGKVSEFGSVKVEKYMEIERFSHVMHIGSTVKGEIRSDMDALDAIEAVLPAGTLSGAPKLMACSIIDELAASASGSRTGRTARSSSDRAPGSWRTASPRTSTASA